MPNDPPFATQPLPDSDQTSYRVVVFSAVEEPDAVEQALMMLPGMDRATAKLQSRLMPGIIPYPYSLEAALTGADSVQALGLHASAVPAGRIPDLLHAHQAHHVRLTKDGLEVIHPQGRQQTFAWNCIALISVGVLPTSAPGRFRPVSALSYGSSHHIWNEGVRLGGKTRPEAFIVLSNDEPALLLASDEMNYEALEDRRTNSSTANFRLLIQDLTARATSARLTPSTRDFLHHEPHEHHVFRSHADFRHYTEFQSLAHLAGPGSLPPGPLPAGSSQRDTADG